MIDPIRKDALVLAVAQARARLDNASRLVVPRVPASASARRMAVLLEILSPLVTALELLMSDTDRWS
jgi:hypothetical protein